MVVKYSINGGILKARALLDTTFPPKKVVKITRSDIAFFLFTPNGQFECFFSVAQRRNKSVSRTFWNTKVLDTIFPPEKVLKITRSDIAFFFNKLKRGQFECFFSVAQRRNKSVSRTFWNTSASRYNFSLPKRS